MANRRLQQSPRVGLLIETSMAYGRGLLRGILRYVREHEHWNVMVERMAEEGTFDVSSFRGDGIIARVRRPELVPVLTELNVPRVLFGPLTVAVGPASKGGAPAVGGPGTDEAAVGRLAAHHFIERGFTHYGFCGFPHLRAWGRDFGFRTALEEAGFSCSVYEPTLPGIQTAAWEDQQKDLAAWLTGLPRPVAIMAMNDERGRHVIEACWDAGLRVPEDVAVLGVDNDELLCAMCDPPLSSVSLQTEQIGYEAAAMLDTMMAGRLPQTPSKRFTPAGIVTRQSSDILAIADEDVAAAVRYIRDHAVESLQVDDVLRHIPSSRRGLERRFKAVLHRTLHDEIRRVRIELAKRLLLETDKPMPWIAGRCGYPNAPRLTEAFVRETGLAPSVFRRRYAARR